MILTKNKLKNKEIKVDDEDEEHYMNFLRFKHLMDRRDRARNRTSRGTQTEIETNNDKATDTFNDFDEVLEPFRLKMRSENFEGNQKATQTNAMRDQETEPRVRVNDDAYTLKGSERAFKSKLRNRRNASADASRARRDMMLQVYMAPLKDTSTDTDDDDENKASNALKAMGLGFGIGAAGLYATYHGLRIGVNITQMLLEGAINLYDALQMQQEEQEEAEKEQEQEQEQEQEAEEETIGSDEQSSSPAQSGQDVDEINSSPPITVHSSSASSNVEDVDINDAWMRQRSRSRSITPDRGYPRTK